MKLFILLICVISLCSCLRNSGTIKGTPLSLQWEVNDGEINIEIHSKKLMFIPILLNSKMGDSDMWVCSKQKSKWEVEDYWSTGHKVPTPDHKFNGSRDLTHTSVNVSDNQIRCGFKRKLLTDDQYDIQLHQNQTLQVCSQDSDTLNLTKHAKMSDVFCFNWTLKQGIKDFEFQPIRLKPSPDIKLLHGVILTIGWGLLIDLGIMVVKYFRTLKYYKLAHTLIFIFVNFSSIPLIIMLIVREQKPIFHAFSKMSLAKQIHTVLGFMTLILLIIQHALGMIAQYYQQNQKSKAKKYRILQISHKIVGYSLYIITKIQVINGWWIYKKSKFLVIFIMGILCTVLFLSYALMQKLYKSGKLQKFLDSFNTQNKDLVKPITFASEYNLVLNQSLIATDNLVSDILSGNSRSYFLKQYPKRKFYFFKNMICQLIDFNHPGSNSLTTQTVGRDITKYVYGMMPLQGNKTNSFQHSQYTVTLLTKASIGIYVKNLNKLQNTKNWAIKSTIEVSKDVFKISLQNNTFQIDLFPHNCQSFLGRYWLVTTNNATRAYTLLLSQTTQNIKVRNSLLQFIDSNFTSQVQNISPTLKTNQIVCIIKKYQLGIVSNEIHQKKSIKDIQGLYGVGLDIKQGLNIIVTGGTGILPFLDLFDILFKKAIYMCAKKINKIENLPPYLSQFQHKFKYSRFSVYCSFKNIQQFYYYSWLVKLHQLSAKYNLQLFELYLKQIQYPDILSYEGKINQSFFYNLKQQNIEFSKVFCCGPYSMGDQVLKTFLALGYQEDMITVL